MDMFKHFSSESKILRYPLQTSKIIFEDYQQKDKSIYLKHNFLGIGLPKSEQLLLRKYSKV